MDEDLKKVKEILTNNRVKLEGGYFRVTRERDGEGDVGKLTPVDRRTWDMVGEEGEIIVGLSMTVGFYGWTTTPVTDIMYVSEDKKEAKVKTLNSVYHIIAVEPQK
jgi:hypothetical protein